MDPVIYHGTPMTPRAALREVGAGRAMCVSFFRPEDAEVVEAISPDVMFRQRCVFVLAGGDEARRGLERDTRLAAVFRLAGASDLRARPVGDLAGHPRRTVPAQRYAAAIMAVRSEGRARLAYGRADRAVASALRSMGPRMSRLDRTEGRIVGLSGTHGRSGQGARQQLACPAHAPRDGGGLRLPVHFGGQHVSRAEWMAV